MKQLLNKCKQTLKTGLAYIRKTDVYVTEDVRLIRTAGSYPAIGIKDGGIRYATETSDQGDESYGVIFAAYVHLTRQETAIMGAADQKGVLDVAADIVTCLQGETFDGRFDAVRVISQSESEILVVDGKAVVMLLVRLEFDIFQ